MLKIHNSNTIIGAYKSLLKQLKNDYNLDDNYLIIVADRYTLQCEHDILKYLDLKGAFNIDIVTFSRLASKLIKGNKCLSPEGSVMLLSKVIYDNQSNLKYYTNLSNNNNFVRDMYATITAIRNSGITVQNLEELLKNLKNAIKDKTQDIITIYKAYLNELSLSLMDGTTKIEELQKVISKTELIKNNHIYITEINDFNAQCLDVIEDMIKNCISVDISIPCYPKGENYRLYPMNTLYKLRNIAKSNNIYFEEKLNIENQNVDSNLIEKYLFSFDKGYEKERAGKSRIKTYEANNITSEVEYISYTISKSIKEKGMRYKDFSIVCTDIDNYKMAITKFFKDYDIPYHLDVDEKLDNHSLIKLILSAFNAINNNYKQENVIDFFKNPLLELNVLDIFDFENYVLKYNINYARFQNPLSLGLNAVKMEQVRQSIINYLKPFEKLKECNKISDYCDLILNYFIDFDFKKRLENQKVLQENAGFNYEALKTEQIYNKVVNLLTMFKEITPDNQCNLTEFLNQLKQSILNLKIVLLPSSIDCVVIRNVNNSNFADFKHLIIMGAMDGILPFDGDDKSIISIKDALIWEKNNITFRPTIKDNLTAERFKILQLLMMNVDDISITYSMKKADNTECLPSLIVGQINKIFNIKSISVNEIINKRIDRNINTNDLANLCATYKNGLKILITGIINLNNIQKNCTPFKHFDTEHITFDTNNDIKLPLNSDLKSDSNSNSKTISNNEIKSDLNSFSNIITDNELKSDTNSISKPVLGTDTEAVFDSDFKPIDALYEALKEKINNIDDLLNKKEYSDLKCEDNFKFFFNGNMKEAIVSISQIENYFDCPYKHFVQYGLRAKDRDVSDIKSFNIGIIVHEVLEKFFKYEDYLTCNLKERVNCILDEILKDEVYSAMLLNVNSKMILKGVTKECYKIIERLLTYENNSSFKPIYLELKINDDKSFNFDDKKLKLYGKIDRVDKNDNYIIIIDYKTGKSHEDLSYVYFGQKIQLYIYLDTLIKNGDLKPASVFYVPIKDSYLSEEKDNNKVLFDGQINNDINVIRMIDNSLINDYINTNNIIKIKFKNDGNISKTTNKKNIIDEQFFYVISNYAVELTKEAIKEINEGYIEPKPFNIKGGLNCSRCNYFGICNFDKFNNKIRDIKEDKDLKSSKGEINIESFINERKKEK